MLHSYSIFWSYHPCCNWTKHITSTSSCSKCLRIEKNKKGFGSVGVFPPIEHMHLISTLSLWAGHISNKVWEDSRFLRFLQVKVTNLSNQNQNSKPRRVWWKKVTSPLEVSSQESSSSEQTEVLDQWTSRGEVRIEGLTTPNPHQNS